MQRHELGIQNYLEQRDDAMIGVVTANSIGTFFSPLADMLLRDTSAAQAKVIPTTACTNTSGLDERRYLAKRFHIETVVTSHDPRRPNFSENTSIHESLLICRRRTGSVDHNRPTQFFSLRTMPSTQTEAIDAAEAIRTGTASKWATVYQQPAERVRRGDWRPCQFLDPELAGAAMRLEQEKALVPLQSLYRLGPAGQRIRDAFRPVDGGKGDYRVFWSRASNLRSTMEATPEQAVEDKKAALAARYRSQAGYVLIAAKFRTDSGRLLAVFSSTASLGSMWVPIQSGFANIEESKALCAWFNSTLGALGFLTRRGTMLTNPSFSQADLATLRIPNFRTISTALLADAFNETCQLLMEPWKNAANDPMRDQLDQAAAATTGIALETIRDWRSRISLEPTVSNERVAG